jgi:hypothetical protein
MNFYPVPANAEYKRIAALPRRKLEGFADLVTPEFRRPGSSAMLRPIQAAAIAELADNRGLFAPIAVGGGKTLLSLLAPLLLAAAKPLLLLPAGMIEAFRRDVARYSRDWYVCAGIQTCSYEMLSQAKNEKYLFELEPDLIILDECHAAKNVSGARAKRINRYLKANKETSVIAMSGSVTSRTIKDYAHTAFWCLRTKSPVPYNYVDVQVWSEALDEKVFIRRPPGVLGRDIDAAREWFAARLRDTPGVVTSSERAVPNVGLIIDKVEHKTSVVVSAALEKLRVDWELPDGAPFDTAIDFWRHSQELSMGFYYKWLYPPPKEWWMARKAWSVYCRETNGRYDTPGAIAMAIDNGVIDDPCNCLSIWRKVAPTFVPETSAHWIDRSVLDTIVKWLNGRKKTLIWVWQKAVGSELHRITGLPYFSHNALDGSGRHIYDCKSNAIVSVQACGTGLNLQAWDTNLITTHPPNGAKTEQTLGRTHRPEQYADDVYVYYLISSQIQELNLLEAIRDAEYIEQTIGSPQKLCYGTKIWKG